MGEHGEAVGLAGNLSKSGEPRILHLFYLSDLS